MTTTYLKPEARPALAAPFISVVVPVRNEERFIRQTLEQLLNQDYDPDRFEVLVADGDSTDSTVAVIRNMQVRHPNLHLVRNPRRWSSAGRNQAIRAARGDLLVVVDGHCELKSSHYLWDLADAFSRSGADCLGRPQPLDVSDATPVQRAIATARSSVLGHHPDSFIYSHQERFVRPQSVAVAYRREVFGRLGLFDETFDACEDVEFNHRLDRAGLSCFFTPRIAVHYHPRASLSGLFAQMVRYGRGRVRLLRKHPETFTFPGFAPALLLAGLVIGVVAAPFSGTLALSYLTILATYILIVGLTSVVLAVKERSLSLLPWLPAIFVAIHAGAGAGIWQELVMGAPTPRLTPEQAGTVKKVERREPRIAA